MGIPKIHEILKFHENPLNLTKNTINMLKIGLNRPILSKSERFLSTSHHEIHLEIDNICPKSGKYCPKIA